MQNISANDQRLVWHCPTPGLFRQTQNLVLRHFSTVHVLEKGDLKVGELFHLFEDEEWNEKER